VLNSVIWTGDRLFAGDNNGWLLSSLDGVDLKSVGFVPINIQSIAFTGRLLVVVRGGIQTPSDGKNWTSRKLNGEYLSRGPDHGVWTGSQLLAVGESGLIISSPDGVNWTEHKTGYTIDLNCVLWTGAEFVAVGDRGLILSSSNGDIWRVHNSGTESNLKSIVKADDRLFAVGDFGTIVAADLEK